MEETNNDKLIDDLISVIIPVYNVERYLDRCLGSIIGQTYKKIEIILIDDGSTDNSGKICDEYVLNDKRIKVIHTENNGPAAARNIGIENSKGSFIFFLDSDDFIENNAISLLIENYRRIKADIIIGDFRKINDNNNPDSGHGRILLESKLLTKKDIIDYVRCYLKKPNSFQLFAYSWGRLFKSSIIKNNDIHFDNNLRTFEDVAFNFDYLNHIEKASFLKETIYNHLVFNNYTSAAMAIGNHPEILFGYRQALIRIKSFLKDCGFGINIEKEVGHADIFLAIIQLVRICGQINSSNKKKTYEFICQIINDSNFRDNLRFYSPSKGESKIIPVLMKLKLVRLIIWMCQYKAFKRYKKLKKEDIIK
ncbi:glycosyltransferase family 2 protein [Patescibacteria group bacterium]|nr:glycosyltransferase family 2 protein [Patescibacteria group bacterium]